MRIVFIVALIALSGCASGGLNGFCGRVTGEGLTVPYIGGKANADGFACHIGCVGLKCQTPDYTVLESVMNHFADAQTTNGKIMTQGPGIVTFIPSK